jgi:hypothetical protein
MSSRRDALFQLLKAIAARRAEMVEVNDRLLADGIISKEEHAASEAQTCLTCVARRTEALDEYAASARTDTLGSPPAPAATTPARSQQATARRGGTAVIRLPSASLVAPRRRHRRRQDVLVSSVTALSSAATATTRVLLCKPITAYFSSIPSWNPAALHAGDVDSDDMDVEEQVRNIRILPCLHSAYIGMKVRVLDDAHHV